jgi:hypothetical protein
MRYDKLKECTSIDRCENAVDGSVHRTRFGTHENINPNEYFTCKEGVSKLERCRDPDSTYDLATKSCISGDLCLKKADGFRYKNTINDKK